MERYCPQDLEYKTIFMGDLRFAIKIDRFLLQNCNSPVPVLNPSSKSWTDVSQKWVFDPPIPPPHKQTFSLVPGIPAEPKLVDILRALS